MHERISEGSRVSIATYERRLAFDGASSGSQQVLGREEKPDGLTCSLYRIVVFPAESSPTIKIRTCLVV